MWSENKDLEHQTQITVGKEDPWMVLDQISDKAKKSIATNYDLGREGEASQGVAVMRDDLSMAKTAGKLSKENTGNVKERNPYELGTYYMGQRSFPSPLSLQVSLTIVYAIVLISITYSFPIFFP